MQRLAPSYPLRAVLVTVLCIAIASAIPWPAVAASLFADQHQVTVQLTTNDGKPMADAEVRVFAPAAPNRPFTTGRTDSSGKFVFTADRDGFWSAEARRDDEIARVSIRVGKPDEPETEPLSPYLILGVLVVLLAIAAWYRILRARTTARRR